MLIGLTGGIGSGKSTVATIFRDLGAEVVDADQVARDLQAAGTPLVQAMVRAFGDGIVDADGNLDRAAVAELVFGAEPQHQANLALLNQVTHPVIDAEIRRRLDVAQRRSSVVVLDHPLLAERPREGIDLVVVVDVPTSTQVERLVEHRHMAPADAQRRIESQVSREDRLAIADVVIDNSGDHDSLRARVGEVWSEVQRHEGGTTGGTTERVGKNH